MAGDELVVGYGRRREVVGNRGELRGEVRWRGRGWELYHLTQ
jgi:hypothetical protein